MRIPMHVKKGDTVQIISGDDKGKVGEIAKVLHPLITQLALLQMNKVLRPRILRSQN